MNNFEKHLRDNRKQLEAKKVNPQIWLSIENEILRTKDKRKTIYLKIEKLGWKRVCLFLSHHSSEAAMTPLSKHDNTGISLYSLSNQKAISAV